MKFVLDKSKWLRGQATPENESALLTSEGKQCCVGQWCSQVGIPDEALRFRGSVIQLNAEHMLKFKEAWGDQIDSWGTKLSGCYNINDNGYTTDDEKIERLRETLAGLGHELEVIESAQEGAGK